ncbi:cobaltochelatase subunit CobN [Methanosarcina sp.]|uniref:cobaltochelatase subunit CobN n=2 Tax=Methanosarcina sp. TaxID=2213 RepID=UPI002988AB46|nr:cobaltochelatase subunit CobN [Methanosarcina sp.]MDW5550044.1 cobaltochelatase subunit CobN [Methanosarcina sp.]MDW5553998.1 cobaltochelatase subunit CobN [Methanosarcina sp.]MDW5558497.1 cobaltochelatase subunit CobN [Methanosarcina sp.]
MRTAQSRLLVLCAVILLMLAQNVSADGNHVNITFICYDGSALATAEQSNPYNSSINVTYISGYSDFSNVTFENQDVIFTYMLWSQFEDIGDDLESAHKNGTALIDISSAIDSTYINTSSYDHIFTGTKPYNSTEEKFFYNMGSRGILKKNTENFITYLAKTYGDKPELTKNWVYEDPVEFPEAAIYHPDARSSTNESQPDWFENTTDYLEWYSNSTNSNESRHIYDKSKPTIGIWFHASDYTGDNLEVIDALIHDLEGKGCNVIAGFDTFNDIHKFYFDENGNPLVQCVISLKSFRLNYDDPDKGVQELKDLDVPVLTGLVVTNPANSTDIADGNRGIPSEEVVYKTLLPSIDGIFEYIVVGIDNYDSETGESNYEPLPSQIDWMANRSINWANLKFKDNGDKKVAVIYYNYPSGKDNIVANYLNSTQSMFELLNAMNKSGYEVSGVPENSSKLMEMLQAQGINVGSWAPGILNGMVENRTEWGLQLIPMDTYKEWFESEIPENLRSNVTSEWGEPWSEDLPQNKSVMIYENETGKYIVIPTVRFGNVWLMPQPARGTGQNNDTLYHSNVVPPTHQYIAFYLWLHHEFKPDALINMGTHGTHEWLPGSTYGMNRTSDWSPLLLQDTPNIYPYIVANVGEGITAEYRGNALIIDHLTPTLERGGLYGDLQNLSTNVEGYYDPGISSQTKTGYQKAIINEIIALNLSVDLGIDNVTTLQNYNETEFGNFVKNSLHEYLEDIGNENIPYGMHILSHVPTTNKTDPESDELTGMVRAMLGGNFEENVTAAFYPESAYPLGIPLNDTKVTKLVWEVVTNNTSTSKAQTAVYGKTNSTVTLDLEQGLDYKDRLLNCDVEIDRILSALSGGFIPPGSGLDPIMNPDAVPTGCNYYSINSKLYPSEATWEVGKSLAIQLLEDYYKEHGEYPKKVSFSRFGVEFIADHGTLEAEVLYLLGVKPVWDENGYVTGVEAIPEEELLPNYDTSKTGRPRIDVVYSTAGMRDAFPDKIKMIDSAVKLASSLPGVNYPNYVNQSSLTLYDSLLAAGYDNETATKLSTMRCFAVMDGTYDIGVSDAISASGTWENEEAIANVYLNKMGYAYGEDFWGIQCRELLEGNLKSVEASVHSSSSNLYDSLDNDDLFQYFGGMNLATRYLSGKTPEMYISDTSDLDRAQMVGMQEYLSKDLRARYFNDKWIEGMKNSGYSGGSMMSDFVNNLFGWEVSDPELVDDTVWQDVYETYVNDPSMKEWFKKNNPNAYQSVTARMLEAVRHDYWKPSEDVVENLAKEYEESVAENGVSCCHHTCGNPLLNEFVSGTVSVPGYAEQIETATKAKDLETTEETQSSSGSHHDHNTGNATVVPKTSSSSNQTSQDSSGGYGTDTSKPEPEVKKSADTDYVEGYEMQKDSAEEPENNGVSFSGSDIFGILFVVVAAGGIYLGIRKK